MQTTYVDFRRTFFIAVLSLLAVLVTSLSQADTKGEAAKEEIREAATAIGDYTAEQKDAAVAKAKELMDKLDDQIHVWEGRFEENWQDLKKSSQENYKTSMQELRKKRNDLSEWYGSMKHSSADAWEEVKKGFTDTYDQMVKSLDQNQEKMNTEK